jgi:ABC-2 type transport system permease protein
MTRLWEVFRFELGYQARRGSTRLWFALFVGLALLLSGAIVFDARKDGYFFNAPLITALLTIIASMFALLVTAAVAGDAATRDEDVRMHSLLYTTPLPRSAYVGGRFIGAFVVTALLLLAVPLGLLLATRLPGIEPQILGPFRLEGYLTSYFVLAVPNAFVATAVLFSIAALTRRALSAYAGATILVFGSFFSQGFLAVHLGRWDLAKVLDPAGFTTLLAIWRSSNPLQKKTLAIGLDGALLANRLLWLGVALAALAIACTRFRFAFDTGSRGWRRARVSVDAPPQRWTRVAVPHAQRTFAFATRLHQLRAIAFGSFRELLSGRGWLVVPIAAAVFIALAPELLEVELGTPGAATTARVAAILGGFELTVLMTMLTALFAGELVWRERDARMHAIADVTPVPEWLSFTGRFLGLGLLLVSAQMLFLVAGVIAQLMQGVTRIDAGVYAMTLFGFQLTGYLLFAALAMFIHVLVNRKHGANVLVLLAWLVTDKARELGVEHNLLLYGGAPAVPYSDLAGFGAQLGPWTWFTLYWAGWALLLTVLAYLFWIRGDEHRRFALARRRLTLRPATIGAAAIAVIAIAGGFIYRNVHVLNHYRTTAELEERSAAYERRYGKYAALAQPSLAATKLHVDFHPQRGTASMRGTYRLENRSGASIGTIHVATNPNVTTNGVSFDRPFRSTLTDDDLGHRIYALDRLLQPGESLQMHFEVEFAPRGFTNAGRDSSVLPNGSWIEHRGGQSPGPRRWLPSVGYLTSRELDNPIARKQHGLREKPADRPLHDLAARREQAGREKIEFEAIVGTDADQIAVAPGALRRRWTAQGRNYFHYVADAPITNIYAIFSANYAVHRARWRDVDIEIFHHPAHTANLERMVQSVRASLETNTRNFSAYPHKQLRLVEFPGAGNDLSLTSYPGLIKYSEAFALVRPDDDERQIDLPFAVVAHEMGHQWWPHRLLPAPVEGAVLLSENLAWYSAMDTVEHARGREHLVRLLDVMRHEYLAPHETRQVPLLRAVDTIDGYRTGPFAMFALREAVGEERVNAALRNLLARFDPARPPYPTSLDLYDELRAVTPAPMHYLLNDLFTEITFWDLQTKKVDVQPERGAYRVTLHVDAQKLKSDAMGKETPAPMHDFIDVALFDANGKSIYRRPHRIRSGAQTIAVVVPRRPASAGLDPDHTLLDRKPNDNVVAVSGS